ncbi:MAG: putative baseplate assembly protein [Nitrospirales bacterium]|nr:putative baseplate assembly protein [Nitrospirales bacterium]
MITTPPKIDKRTFSLMADTLLSMAPHYTPEWRAEEGDAGVALAKIHAFITEMVTTRLNQVPRKSLIAFLDMLGVSLLPAQPSRVPITFKPAKGADRDILVSPRTQASAVKTDAHDEVPFETEKSLLAVIGKLRELISVDPEADAIYVHTTGVVAEDGSIRDSQTAFTLFSGTNQQEHSLYLGQKDLLNIKGTGEIRLALTVPLAPGNLPLDLIWEYWGEDKEKKIDRWIGLDVLSDGTDGLSQSGEISLSKGLEGEIREAKLKDIFAGTGRVAIRDDAVAQIKNRWIRCRLVSVLTSTICSKLPELDTVFLRTAPAEPVPVDAGFFNDVPLDYARESIEAKIKDCGVSTPEIIVLMSATGPSETLYVDSVGKFMEGDSVLILRDGSVLTGAIISRIDEKSKSMTVSFSGSYTCREGDRVQSKAKLGKVFVFGSQPKLYDAFYIGSKEAFSKKGAKITLAFTLRISDSSSGLQPLPDPMLAWEYWDGKGWQAITLLKDDTGRLLQQGDNLAVEFFCPQGIEETEVFGQKNYWIRTRIIGGDYGREEYTIDPSTNKISVERKFKLPVIRDLTVGYSFDKSVELQACFSYNNLAFEDITTQAATAGVSFTPFVPLPDGEKAFYLGFDRQLLEGPIGIFFDAHELQYAEKSKPEIEWRFSSNQGWATLDYLDETEGFVSQGILDFIGPEGFIAMRIFDSSFYWLRGGLVKGAYKALPHLRGVFPNTTWAVQAETIREEILGSGNGEPGQSFSFFKSPVMEGEEVRVKEVISEEERQQLIAVYGSGVISETRDEAGEVTETWLLWRETSDFFYSGEKSRDYTIDRATGKIGFGNGINGMIPPAGKDNIKAFSYRTGGGLKGNVKAFEIKSLKSQVSGIDKVMNPIGGDGGADTATVDEMLEIGPAEISHRYRAVTTEDYEWLARMASRKVVRARCLPNRNREGTPETGWVAVIIVPQSADEKPWPSLLLKKEVEEYLIAHSLTAVAFPGQVYVEGPRYVEMSVSVDLFVKTIDVASQAVRAAKQRLAAFFHPLTGGPGGEGWEFGRGVAISDVYSLLEGIEGVDHVENLIFQDAAEGDFIAIPPDALVADGEHSINARLNGGG